MTDNMFSSNVDDFFYLHYGVRIYASSFTSIITIKRQFYVVVKLCYRLQVSLLWHV